LTNNDVTPALDAAHIRPFSEGGDHSVQNGILLRKDLHSLFDAGLVAFDSERKFQVSQIISDNFFDASDYLALQGQAVRIPENPELAASDKYLSWHRQNVFRG
jgi:putative restriction endonuclease